MAAPVKPVTVGDLITDLINAGTIEEVDEKLVSSASELVRDQMLGSIAISLKRIADSLDCSGHQNNLADMVAGIESNTRPRG